MAIPVDGLVSKRTLDWARHIHNISGRDRVINYWLNTEGEGRNKTWFSRREVKGAKRIFRQVDRVTGIEFNRVKNIRRSDIEVHIAKDLPGSTIGFAKKKSWSFKIVWEDMGGTRMTQEEKSTLAHEVLHTLGLGHPYGDGYHPGFNSSDTIMSYNSMGWSGLPQSDVAALQSIWGA